MSNYRCFINLFCFLIGLFISITFVSFSYADNWQAWVDYGLPGSVTSCGYIAWTNADSLRDAYTCDVYPHRTTNTGVVEGVYASHISEKCLAESDAYQQDQLEKAVNGIKDNGEDGIDCGGTTGVNCVQRCPYGFIIDDGVCVKSAGMGPNPDGGDDIPYINPAIQATPILASPDLTILDDQWDISNNILPSDDYSTSLIDNTSSIFSEADYVIRDNSGNVVGSQLTGDLQSTDNGDGTRSEVQTQTTYNPITNVDRTSTQTNIYNSETNELISSNVSSSGSSSVHNIPNAIESGLGSGKSLSGDQYAHGNSDVLQSLADIKSAIDGDPDDPAVDVPAFAVEGVDFDGTLSPDDIPEKLSIPDTISDFVANSPLFILLNSLKVDIADPQCKFTVEGLSFFGKSMSLDFDMCRWQDFLQSLGAFMLMFTQALAVIVIFRGLK